ncbi:MAG: hypothetical protein LBV27_08550 [Oscillospiraceae bacterium]|jgi:hypothetical protein|nr:hypothetical protein [Oscillospiraceae bacterium]
MKFFRFCADERQEQELSKLESRGFWIMMGALMIGLFVKGLSPDVSLYNVAGELFALAAGALFVGIGSVVKGHWPLSLKPSFRTYCIYSLAAAVTVPAIGGVLIYIRHASVNITALLFNMVLVFAFCFIFSLVTGALTKKRSAKLELECRDKP